MKARSLKLMSMQKTKLNRNQDRIKIVNCFLLRKSLYKPRKKLNKLLDKIKIASYFS